MPPPGSQGTRSRGASPSLPRASFGSRLQVPLAVLLTLGGGALVSGLGQGRGGSWLGADAPIASSTGSIPRKWRARTAPAGGPWSRVLDLAPEVLELQRVDTAGEAPALLITTRREVALLAPDSLELVLLASIDPAAPATARLPAELSAEGLQAAWLEPDRSLAISGRQRTLLTGTLDGEWLRQSLLEERSPPGQLLGAAGGVFTSGNRLGAWSRDLEGVREVAGAPPDRADRLARQPAAEPGEEDSLVLAGPGGLWFHGKQGWVRIWEAPAPIDTRALLVAADGSHLIGTRNGLLQVSALGDAAHLQLTGLPVHALAEAPDGALWAGVWDGGLRLREQGKWHSLSHDQGLPGNAVGSLQVESGRLWLAVPGKGLFFAEEAAVRRQILTPSTERLLPGARLFPSEQTANQALGPSPASSAQRLAPVSPRQVARITGSVLGEVGPAGTDPTGRTWVALTPRIQPETGVHTGPSLMIADPGTRGTLLLSPHQGLAGWSTRALLPIRTGKMLVGTEAGISLLDFPPGLDVPRVRRFPATGRLPVPSVHCLSRDRHGVVWIGHQRWGDGLTATAGGEVGRVTSQDGLLIREVERIGHDDLDRVWVFAEGGEVGVYPRAALLERAFSGASRW